MQAKASGGGKPLNADQERKRGALPALKAAAGALEAALAAALAAAAAAGVVPAK